MPQLDGSVERYYAKLDHPEVKVSLLLQDAPGPHPDADTAEDVEAHELVAAYLDRIDALLRDAESRFLPWSRAPRRTGHLWWLASPTGRERSQSRTSPRR